MENMKNVLRCRVKKDERNVVVIISGGMDSTTLIHLLHNQKFNIKALSFDYRQRHLKELQYATETCRRLNIEHHIVDLSSITKLISNSALTSDIVVPHGHYEDESMKITVVPGRNTIMLAIAVGYAENLKYKYVAIGNHLGDRSIYPDCRKEYIRAMNRASQLGTYSKVKIISPFCNMTKTDIVKVGLKLGIDYDRETWSCYEGNEKPCEKCGTCAERNEAIVAAKQ